MMRRLIGCLRRFRADASGQIAIIFGLSSVLMMVGVGAGIDLARAYQARQKLSEVATLACQYSNRDLVEQTANATFSGSAGFQTYVSAVNGFAATSLASQNWGLPTPTGASGTAGAYFTATPAVGGSATLPTNASVTMASSVPTSLMQLIGVTTIPIRASVNCGPPQQAASPPVLIGNDPVGPGGPSGPGNFDKTPCSGFCFIQPNGSPGTVGVTPTQTFPPTAAYDGWYIVGYCLEIDNVGIINATEPGNSIHNAELDCDNGAGSKGNSSISKKVYLQAGSYELRYFYRSRMDYPNYSPTYICGTTASDVSWANDTGESVGFGGARTNQINVYLDMNQNGAAPLHKTIDNTQSLAGSNLIDVCVYGPNWIERSVRITVTTPAYYWLSFAADGVSDSYGGQLDNIRLCPDKCSGLPQDNFPPAWLNNGGVNKLLFEDGFESPTYTQDPSTSSAHAKGGNLANSNGTTVSIGCNITGTTFYYPSPPGWPCQSSPGWAVAPYNEVVYWMQGATQGHQYISLQGSSGFDPPATASSDPLNRSISRPFLLDPGYYSVSYDYTSMVDFSYDFLYGVACVPGPTQSISPWSGPGGYSIFGIKNGDAYPYPPATLYHQYESTNIASVYMSNGQLISTPSVNNTLGGPPTYTNPDGTTSSTPTAPPDNSSNFAAYNSAAVNPVIDTCIYSSGYTWITRSATVKITKPGWYWITLSAQGDPLTGTGAGPAIDDVKLTALGSLYMTPVPQSVQVAPSQITTTPPTTIPVPDPQPDTTYTNSGQFNGFSIIADPQTPTGGP